MISIFKRIIFSFLLMLPIKLYAEVITKKDLLETGLPLLIIETINGEEPTCDYVTHPEGAMGEGITNRTKVGGAIILLQGNDVLYDSGAYEEGKSGMTIRLRGNSSAYTEKKPYKIKLQKKADLLGRGEQYADKDWLLIKDEVSFTNENEMSLKPLIGFKVNEIIGMQWTPSGRYVNMMINNEYRGIYYLVESVKRNNRSRINIDKETGYLIEYDPYWWNEPVYFDTNMTSTSMSFKYTFKEPDDEELTEEKIAYIKNYMDEVELSIANDTYEKYIDVLSFVNWILASDILGTDDGGGANVFLTKYDNTPQSKVMMGNLWDFDGIMKHDNQWPANHNILYFKKLRENSSFNNAYVGRWRKIINYLEQELNSFFDDYLVSSEAKALDNARIFEHQLWGSEYRTVASNIQTARSWFTSRLSWLEQRVSEISYQETKFTNELTIQNDGKVEINGVVRDNGDTFTTTSYEDIVLVFKPGKNMTLTSLEIDGIDVTNDVISNEYKIPFVLEGHDINVRYDRTIISLDLNYSTYCSTANLDFTTIEGLDAYIAKSYDCNNGIILLDKVERVPARTGLVIVGTAGEKYQIPIAETTQVISENLLVGTNQDVFIYPTEGVCQNYILSNRTAGVGFYMITAAGTLSAGKAYLQIPTSNNSRVLKLDIQDNNGDNVTEIKPHYNSSDNESCIYTLAGQRVNKTIIGLMIKDGIKILNKK